MLSLRPTLCKRFCHRRLRCSSKGKGRCHIFVVPCLPCLNPSASSRTNWHAKVTLVQQRHQTRQEGRDSKSGMAYWSMTTMMCPEIVHRNDPVEECLHRDEQRWVAQRDAVPLQPLSERLQAVSKPKNGKWGTCRVRNKCMVPTVQWGGKRPGSVVCRCPLWKERTETGQRQCWASEPFLGELTTCQRQPRKGCG